jgi:ferric-dicitrate binding protein FerR (iron transport regulator)
VLLIFGIGFYIYYAFLGNQFTTVQTAQGETKQVNLPDGSQAWIAPLTTLAYSFDNNERTIKLDGEAFFEVVKNPQKPFVVNTQLAVTKVLGTSFNLIAYQTQKEVKLTVATGKVSFKSIKSNQENIVLASQSAEINDLGENKILSNFDINETTWSQKKLVFENQPLSKVFTTVAHLYHVKIEVNNPLIHNCHFTGQFTDATLADVMDVICKTMQLSYQKNQNIVTVTGKGCK